MLRYRSLASRLRIAYGFLFAVIGLLTLSVSEPIRLYFNLRGYAVLIFGITSVLVGTAFLLLAYLRGELIPSDRQSGDYYEALVNNRAMESFPEELRYLSTELATLKDVVERGRIDPRPSIELNAEEKASLRSELKNQLEGVLANDLVKQIEEKYSAKILDDTQISQIRKSFEITSQRLRQEIAALSRKSNVNLVIGILTTVVAVGMLGYLVWGSKVTFTNLPDLLSHFIPRISVAAFIEVFSFFFLKLYKSNLEEIKYFQNELTNIEMKIIAHEAALLSQDNKSIPPIIDQLIRTDRNLSTLPATLAKNGAGQLEPKDLAELLDKIGKLLSLGAYK